MKITVKGIKKTNLNDTFFGTYFYRKSATYFTYILAKTSLTPNVISFLSLIFGIISAIFFAFGAYSYSLLAVIFLQIAMILDYSDGQVARLKGLGTTRGAWLDVVLGMIQNNLIVLGIVLGLYVLSHNLNVWYWGFVALFAWNMTCFVHLNAMIFFPKLELKKSELAKKIENKKLIKPQYLSIGSDVYFVVFGITAIFSHLFYGLVFMAFLGNLYWISVAFYFFIVNKNVK